MNEKIKILIVEDEIMSTIFLKRLLIKNNYEVKVAYNGFDALRELELALYDIVLTDWMMPQIDGIELIRRIRENIQPSPYIIMLTALVSEGGRQHALTSGADDFILKPVEVSDLLDKLKVGLEILKSTVNKSDVGNLNIIKNIKLPDFVGIGIATSTGGPPTLVQLISLLKNDISASFFIVQHGPPWMLETFASRLSNETELVVKLAKEGMKIESGTIYISPGDFHLVIKSDLTLSIEDGPKENFVRPSADPLFRSLAQTFNQKSIAIVLTGLGRDGTNGASIIKKAGGKVIVQDPSTSIAPSMPKSVIEENICDFVLPINEISEKCESLINQMLK